LHAVKRKLKQLFHIQTDHPPEADQSILLLEVGERHCCFGILNNSNRELTEYAYYIAQNPGEGFMSEILEQQTGLSHAFKQCAVNYSFAESILVPESHYKEEDGQLHLQAVYGINHKSIVKSGHLYRWKLYAVFRIPQYLHDQLNHKFSPGKSWHNYSVQLKSIPDGMGDALFVEFRTDEISVVVLKKNVLQLVQTFTYSVPADVLYYLLRICRQFSLSQEEVKVDLSGLIEKDSAIYRELYKYFLHLNFASIPEEIKLAGAFSGYPAHYFSSVCKLATCV
jgi:uncharacterized protein DUF3822